MYKLKTHIKKKLNFKRMVTGIQPGIKLSVLFFAVYLVIGLFVLPDYGVTTDEPVQRIRSLVAYKYVNKTVFNREIPELDSVPDLEEYDHGYYGTFMQWPMVAIEDAHRFSMSSRQIYLCRHYFTFIIIFLGYVSLFIALKKIFAPKPSTIPLLIVMMMALYPRFFANQFFDIKNMIFSGLSMMAIVGMVYSVKTQNSASCIGFGIVSAIATNCRVMGIIYPVILLGYWLMTDAFDSIITRGYRTLRQNTIDIKTVWRMLAKYVYVIMTFSITWTAINPIAWNNPIETFINTFNGFSKYEAWNGTMVFMGKLITCDEMPWYYLFVWFGISIPITYLALFVIGNVTSLIKLFRKDKSFVYLILHDYKWEWCFIMLFWGSVLAVIFLKSRIYIGWHHMYFTFVPFCIVAGYGMDSIVGICQKKIAYGAIIVTLLINSVWMFLNHPKEISWFNIIGKQYADQFDREEWCESSYLALKWILQQEAGKVTIDGSIISKETLPQNERDRIISVKENPEYYIEGYRNVIGNVVRKDGYDEVYTVSVDGYNVCSVFKIRE